MRAERPAPFFRSLVVAASWGLALTLAACGSDDPVGGLFELADASAFEGHPGKRSSRAFDVVAADMDDDGDPDLLINWHHRVPLEVYENEGGRFRRVNAPTDDRSGLSDHPGIASLFADSPAMRKLIRESDRAGLHIWHDVQRGGNWRFVWHGDGKSPARFVLEVATALNFEKIEGLEPGEVESPAEGSRRIRVDRDTGDFEFAIKTEQLTSDLQVHLRSSAGDPLPLFVGRDGTEFASGEVVLWKPDPHGVAWVNVEGSPEPELYITRGGLQGELVPPRLPKLDRYYLGGKAGGPWFVSAPDGTVPRDHGRGRSVQWVDVDNDGQLELSVSNEHTPNKLLRRGESGGPFRDVASEFGIDLAGGEVQCWGDHDGDGWQDLYVLDDHAIDVLRNPGGGAFELVEGESLGTIVPASDPTSSRLFNFAALRLVDFDNDGDLDLWVLMFGDELTNHLFLREGDRFERATDRVGLGAVRGNIFAVLFDLDNDGFEDVISSGALNGRPCHALVWHNRGGAEFAIRSLEVVPKDVHIGTNLDADLDGRWDLACMGTERYLLHNVSEGNSWVGVTLRDGGREPVGALVKAWYDDGHVVARRYGSAYNSAYSQTLQPLRFGVGAGRRIERLTVRWPGERQDRTYGAPKPGQTLPIERP